MHSFNRFFVVTKFILPTMKDLKFSALNFDNKCEYSQAKGKEHNSEAKEHILDLITYCRKIKHTCILINNKYHLLIKQCITF